MAILTNPPFKYSTEVIQHALELCLENDLVCMFLKTTALESKRRYQELYSRTPPKMVLQFVERILCAKNGEFEDARSNLGAGAQAYAWFIWEKGYKGNTVLDWLV